MPRARESRIYWRNGRAWGDFRDLGGKREALKPEGEKRATEDPDVAQGLATARVKQLEEERRGRALGIKSEADIVQLGKAAEDHLREKATLEDVTDGWLAESEHMLNRALEFFGEDRDIATISSADVRLWLKDLGTVENGRGGKLSGGTVRHHLNCLSNFFGTCMEKGTVKSNPVQGLRRGTKPKASRQEAAWFEPPEASLILEAAMRFKSPKPQVAIPFPGVLVATFLLTGGRKSEVLGLRVEDISFDRDLIHIRPNSVRRLKTGNATRTVRLWPQLREVLQRHVFEDGHVSGLLFPSPAGTGMIRDLEKMLDGIARFMGWEEGSIRSKAFRHTYCSARLQTVDRVKVGENDEGKPILEAVPVSPFTVAKELGHGGDSLVKRIYGHLGTVRHRSEAVEFRVEDHKEALKDRLEALRIRA